MRLNESVAKRDPAPEPPFCFMDLDLDLDVDVAGFERRMPLHSGTHSPLSRDPCPRRRPSPGPGLGGEDKRVSRQKLISFCCEREIWSPEAPKGRQQIAPGASPGL